MHVLLSSASIKEFSNPESPAFWSCEEVLAVGSQRQRENGDRSVTAVILTADQRFPVPEHDREKERTVSKLEHMGQRFGCPSVCSHVQ